MKHLANSFIQKLLNVCYRQKRVLFIVSSNQHMGDLAFCQEWLEDLGSTKFSFAFLIDHSFKEYISTIDQTFFYDPEYSVKDSVIKTIGAFSPDVVIFASGNGWDMKGLKGGGGVEMLNDEIINSNIPLMAFDTKEGYPGSFLEEYENHPFFGNRKIASPPISNHFVSLLNSPNVSTSPAIQYYKINKRFIPLAKDDKKQVLSRLGIGQDQKVVLFSVPAGNYNIISKLFHDYYSHLAGLFSSCQTLPLQFVVVCGEEIEAFHECKNVTQVQQMPFKQYSGILKSSDLVITDTIWSTSILLAVSAGIPSALICNPPGREETARRNDGKMDWSVFQKTLNLDNDLSDQIRLLINRHKEYLHALCLSPSAINSITPFQYLSDYIRHSPESTQGERIKKLCDFLIKSKPAEEEESYQSISDKNQIMIIKEIFDLLENQQKVILHEMNIQSLLDIDTGYDPLAEPLDDTKKQEPYRKASFTRANLYPYKIFPYGMERVADYLINKYHFAGCFPEIDVFDTENFSKRIGGLLFDKDVYGPVLEKCREVRSRYDNVPSPAKIIKKIISRSGKK